MNGLTYYDRQKEDWNYKELYDIRMEYETNEMTISQIADIHRRTPGSISYKLKNLGLITNTMLSRGYLDYKNSDLYKEIVEKGKCSDAEKKVKNDETLQVKNKGVLNVKRCKEILEMHNEIADLKKDVRILRKMLDQRTFQTGT